MPPNSRSQAWIEAELWENSLARSKDRLIDPAVRRKTLLESAEGCIGTIGHGERR